MSRLLIASTTHMHHAVLCGGVRTLTLKITGEMVLIFYYILALCLAKLFLHIASLNPYSKQEDGPYDPRCTYECAEAQAHTSFIGWKLDLNTVPPPIKSCAFNHNFGILCVGHRFQGAPFGVEKRTRDKCPVHPRQVGA